VSAEPLEVVQELESTLAAGIQQYGLRELQRQCAHDTIIILASTAGTVSRA
jgi:hypothetical protein